MTYNVIVVRGCNTQPKTTDHSWSTTDPIGCPTCPLSTNSQRGQCGPSRISTPSDWQHSEYPFSTLKIFGPRFLARIKQLNINFVDTSYLKEYIELDHENLCSSQLKTLKLTKTGLC